MPVARMTSVFDGQSGPGVDTADGVSRVSTAVEIQSVNGPGITKLTITKAANMVSPKPGDDQTPKPHALSP